MRAAAHVAHRCTSAAPGRAITRAVIVTMGPELIACYWTLSGPATPLRPTQEASPYDLTERLQAAAKAGYCGIGLGFEDLEACVERHGFAEISRMIADNGIKYLELEALLDWFTSGDRRQASDHTRARLLQAAEKLGARHIKIGGDLSGATWPLGQLIESFADLCSQAALVGAQVALEPMPFTSIRDPAVGLEIVSGADHPNGGLLIDIWHVARARFPYKGLTVIPSQWITSIELNDAPAAPTASNPLVDTTCGRLLCGEGDLDVAEFVRCIAATGYEGPYAVEILSEAHRELKPSVAAERSYRTTMDQFSRTAEL